MDIHVAIKLHMRRNRLAYLGLVKFEILVLENVVSVFIRHYVCNRFMQGIGSLRQASINFYITFVVIAILVIVEFVNSSSAIDKSIKIILVVQYATETGRSKEE